MSGHTRWREREREREKEREKKERRWLQNTLHTHVLPSINITLMNEINTRFLHAKQNCISSINYNNSLSCTAAPPLLARFVMHYTLLLLFFFSSSSCWCDCGWYTQKITANTTSFLQHLCCTPRSISTWEDRRGIVRFSANQDSSYLASGSLLYLPIYLSIPLQISLVFSVVL